MANGNEGGNNRNNKSHVYAQLFNASLHNQSRAM